MLCHSRHQQVVGHLRLHPLFLSLNLHLCHLAYQAYWAAASLYCGVFRTFLASASGYQFLAPGMEHHLETEGWPVTAKFCRLDPSKLAAAKAEFDQMERDGIVRRSSSAWSSPLHMVRKADGSWRPCGDFRRLNLATAVDRYPLPNMDDLTARLEGCRVFSKLDLKKGYYQVPMRAEDVHKTAVIKIGRAHV